MIPLFERSGLLPEGEHRCKWSEFADRFGGASDNGRRRKLLIGLAQMLWLLSEAGCQIVLVDGSFVTREKWPRDFDLCYEPQGMNAHLLPPVLRDVINGRLAQKRRFGGEALPVSFPFEPNGRTVREAFARTREGEAKGIVRLELPLIRKQLAQFLEELRPQGEQTDGSAHS